MDIKYLLGNIENIDFNPTKEYQVIRNNRLCCRKHFFFLMHLRYFIVGNATENIKGWYIKY